MNEHEATRIANAMHAARPDWPASSVLTLIRTKLIDRPRRDVFVALAWVASEPASHTPARVLEAGPWWKAAGVEGSATKRDEPEPVDRCSVCSLHRDRCAQLWQGEHEFAPSHRRPELEDTHDRVQSMKSEAARHVRPPDPEKVPVPVDPNVERLREAKAAPIESTSAPTEEATV